MNSINYPTSKTYAYFDYHLQPLVKEIPSYVKDTNDILNKMKDINKFIANILSHNGRKASLYQHIKLRRHSSDKKSA